ncbi:MAG: RNA chaperone Hfq [Candidatus Eremiobacteraeota bacterium]|nr:RNA chaperone Hfq [Candidatus Eremiobacteraeota bacterium]MBV8354062.1 RNA chaperone Hfq [Candidatus Eremiobacteraeota bacterium]
MDRAQRAQPLQDSFLSEVKRQAVPVVVYLMNGFQLRGLVKGFDPFTIVLEYERRTHLIYKHAVSTISPQGPFAARFLPDTESAAAGD